jgi:hypothetical protein
MKMQEKDKVWRIDRIKFLIFGIIMVIVWGSIFTLLYLKADEVTKDPCSICAKQMGENIYCTISGVYPVTRTYTPDGNISDNLDDVKKKIYSEGENYSINISILEGLTKS